mgnify:CR=1 FL=1
MYNQSSSYFGEVTTTAKVDYVEVTKEVINEIGYTAMHRGFDGTKFAVLLCIR